MPTEKPRVTVTLPHEMHEVISEWAELQGVSKGHVIAEMMQAVYPAMVRAAALMRAASEAPREVREGFAETFLNLHEEVVGEYQKSLFEMERQTVRLKERGAKAHSRSRPSGESTPVPVIRGSGSGKTLKNKKTRSGPKS